MIDRSIYIFRKVSEPLFTNNTSCFFKGIFGNQVVPQPRESVVTRWRADPWARGSYSFVAVGSSGSDYDLLAAPVAPPATPGAPPPQPRVFFAGKYLASAIFSPLSRPPLPFEKRTKWTLESDKESPILDVNRIFLREAVLFSPFILNSNPFEIGFRDRFGTSCLENSVLKKKK